MYIEICSNNIVGGFPNVSPCQRGTTYYGVTQCTVAPLAEEFDTFPHKVKTSKLKSDELIQSFVATQKLQDYYFVNSEIQHYSIRLRGIRGGIYKATRISSRDQIRLRKYNFQQESYNFCAPRKYNILKLTNTNTFPFS